MHLLWNNLEIPNVREPDSTDDARYPPLFARANGSIRLQISSGGDKQ
jgi:hypothetical protein